MVNGVRSVLTIERETVLPKPALKKRLHSIRSSVINNFSSPKSERPVTGEEVDLLFKSGKVRNSFILLLLLLLLLFSPAFTGFGKTGKPVVPVDAARLRAHVQALTSIEPPRYYRNEKSLMRAADYIYNQFKAAVSRVRYQEFVVEGKRYRNVIASFGPLKGKHIILGAHYDVCGPQPGADDNGSGVAVLLELSRVLAGMKPRLKHPVTLVTYPLEEPPHFRSPFMGSMVHARSLKRSKTRVRFMISVDMIGFFNKEMENKISSQFAPYVTSGRVKPGNTTGLAGKRGDKRLTRKIYKLMTGNSSIDVIACNPPPGTPTMDFSDHMNYWKNGYKALMLSNFFVCENPHYHKKGDTIEKLDFKRLAQIVKALYAVVIKI